VIVVAVRWYPRYGLSYRDVEELLAERGIEVDHVTVYRWVQRFTPAAGRRRPIRPPRTGRPVVHRRDLREGQRSLALRLSGHRPVRQVIDVLLSTRRDATAARRFSPGHCRR
jgi:transposase, IS6 family